MLLIPSLFLCFFRSIPTWNEVLQKHFFFSFCSFGWFLNQLPNRRWTCLLCWSRTLLAIETNAFRSGDERFSAGDEGVENPQTSATHTHNTHTHNYIATSNFQTDLMSRRLLLTHTHFRKRAVSRSRAYLQWHNSILCWTESYSSRLKLIEKTEASVQTQTQAREKKSGVEIDTNKETQCNDIGNQIECVRHL